MEKLKVGQRIELFEILTDGDYKNRFIMIPNTVRPGVIDTFSGLVDMPVNGYLAMDLHEVRPVGAMIVKKLKTKVPNIADESLAPKVRPIAKYII